MRVAALAPFPEQDVWLGGVAKTAANISDNEKRSQGMPWCTGRAIIYEY